MLSLFDFDYSDLIITALASDTTAEMININKNAIMISIVKAWKADPDHGDVEARFLIG